MLAESLNSAAKEAHTNKNALDDGSATNNNKNLSNLPVHEYWIEHKRAMTLELEQQRSAMMYEIAQSQRSALLGIELVRSKLEDDIDSFYREFRNVLNAVQGSLDEGWRKIQSREKSLLSLQQQLNDSLGVNLRAAKENVMRNAELELSYKDRKEQLEEWALNCQNIILKREEELGATARKLDSDMSAIMVARKRLQSYDREVGARPGTVARIAPLPNATSTSIQGEDDVYQVPVGDTFDLAFQLEMNDIPPHVDRKSFPRLSNFENVPVTLSYIEGKGGQVWGTVQALIQKDGRIELNGVRLEGKGGTSHILLVSVPKTVFGSVHPLEVRVHLYAAPKVDIIGAWKPDSRSLVGRVRLRHVEPFSVSNKKMSLALIIYRDNPNSSGGANNNNNNNNNSRQQQLGTSEQQGGLSSVLGQQQLRSVSASSIATTAVGSVAMAPGGGRIFRCEAEGDGQNDFPFTIAVPNHVWEEIESSTLSLEFRTPNLTVFPALEHKFDVDWMRVQAPPGHLSVQDIADGKTAMKIPMFRHTPGGASPSSAEPVSIIPQQVTFPKSDLITDFAISDSGNLLILIEVSGKISLYRYEFPQKWTLTRCMLLPSEDSHPGGVAFSRSGNVFAIHDTNQKKISVWKVAKVLKTAPPVAQASTTVTELESPEFEVKYLDACLSKDKNGNLQMPFGNNNLPDDHLLASHFKPIEDVSGLALLVQSPAIGLYLFSADSKNRRPALLVDPRGQNTVRTLYHKILPQVGSIAVLGFDNGEVIATATAATKATGKRVQFKFSVVKGSPIVNFSDGPTQDSFLVCTICSVCIVKTQPTWSVMRSSFVTSSPISCVSFGRTPQHVTLDEEEKDGIAVVCHNSGLIASVGIVSGSVLGQAMLPDVGENLSVPTIANAQCADAGELGQRIVSSTSLKPAGWEVKLVSPIGSDENSTRPPVPVVFNKHQPPKQENENDGDEDNNGDVEESEAGES